MYKLAKWFEARLSRSRESGIRRAGVAALVASSLAVWANGSIASVAQSGSQPLPFPDRERLIQVFESNPGIGRPLSEVSGATIVEWAQRAHTLEALGFFGQSRVIFPEDDSGVPARYQSVSPGALAALGVRPILGRIVLRDEDRKPDEVLISYDYWQRRFGRDLRAIDRLHRFQDVNKKPERIIGVMPAGFNVLAPADVWGINVIRRQLTRNARFARTDRVLARIKKGYTMAQTQADLVKVSAGLAQRFPDTHKGWTAIVQPLRMTLGGDIPTARGLPDFGTDKASWPAQTLSQWTGAAVSRPQKLGRRCSSPATDTRW